nr:universal stress protein [Micromonospora provocatoris]
MAAPSHGAVVVGVSRSEADLAVVRTAAAEAAAHDRPLHLLHAFNWAATPGPAPAGGTRTDAENVLEHAGQVVARVRAAGVGQRPDRRGLAGRGAAAGRRHRVPDRAR